MNKLLRLIWLAIIILGLLFIFLWDPGSGLGSPGFWLIPAGVLGGIVTVFKTSRSSNKKWLVGIWSLAFISIAGIFLDIGPDRDSFGGGGLIWIFPALIFTILGLILLIVQLARNNN